MDPLNPELLLGVKGAKTVSCSYSAFNPNIGTISGSADFVVLDGDIISTAAPNDGISSRIIDAGQTAFNGVDLPSLCPPRFQLSGPWDVMTSLSSITSESTGVFEIFDAVVAALIVAALVLLAFVAWDKVRPAIRSAGDPEDDDEDHKYYYVDDRGRERWGIKKQFRNQG